jgi:hypothetical protein
MGSAGLRVNIEIPPRLLFTAGATKAGAKSNGIRCRASIRAVAIHGGDRELRTDAEAGCAVPGTMPLDAGFLPVAPTNCPPAVAC